MTSNTVDLPAAGLQKKFAVFGEFLEKVFEFRMTLGPFNADRRGQLSAPLRTGAEQRLASSLQAIVVTVVAVRMLLVFFISLTSFRRILFRETLGH